MTGHRPGLMVVVLVAVRVVVGHGTELESSSYQRPSGRARRQQVGINKAYYPAGATPPRLFMRRKCHNGVNLYSSGQSSQPGPWSDGAIRYRCSVHGAIALPWSSVADMTSGHIQQTSRYYNRAGGHSTSCFEPKVQLHHLPRESPAAASCGT